MHQCPECGYPNDPGEHRCEKCGIRFDLLDPAFSETPEEAGEESAPPAPPVWKGEVAQRLASFRQRRQSFQAALPLEKPEAPEAPPSRGKIIPFPAPAPAPEEVEPAAERPRAHAPAASPRPAAVRQQDFAFSRPAAEDFTPLLDFPVARLQRRCRAAIWDAMWIALGCATLLGTYLLCGGHFPLNKVTLAAMAAALALLPWFYHSLFLVLCAATPGMRRERLRLVDFNGYPASPERCWTRAWSALFSAAPLLLGFLWAAVDQENLTWHDRMSETCLTSAPLTRAR